MARHRHHGPRPLRLALPGESLDQRRDRKDRFSDVYNDGFAVADRSVDSGVEPEEVIAPDLADLDLRDRGRHLLGVSGRSCQRSHRRSCRLPHQDVEGCTKILFFFKYFLQFVCRL